MSVSTSSPVIITDMQADDDSPPPVEIETGRAPSASIIWLHGLGADGYDFLPVVDQLDSSRLPALRFVFPHAPLRPVTLNNGHIMPAWYDLYGLSSDAPEDEAGLRDAIERVEALIRRENARGIESERIWLAGFSQGGAVALATALRHYERLAGAIVLSAYLPLAKHLPQEASAANRGLPIFMAHGRFDNVIPESVARAAATRLSAAGYRLSWHDYPMAHSVCDQEIADLSDWLAENLAQSRGGAST